MDLLLYPRYEVYRGYIIFAFFCNYVSLSVSVNFFPSKITQQLLELGF